MLESARLFPPITLLLPPGWIIEPRMGFDTLVGTISGGGIEIRYDYGKFSGSILEPDDRAAISRRSPAHNFWVESFGGEELWFVQPVSPLPNDRGITGMWSAKLPGAVGNGIAISMRAEGLDGQQQKIALAVMRSVRNAAFERPEFDLDPFAGLDAVF